MAKILWTADGLPRVGFLEPAAHISSLDLGTQLSLQRFGTTSNYVIIDVAGMKTPNDVRTILGNETGETLSWLEEYLVREQARGGILIFSKMSASVASSFIQRIRQVLLENQYRRGKWLSADFSKFAIVFTGDDNFVISAPPFISTASLRPSAIALKGNPLFRFQTLNRNTFLQLSGCESILNQDQDGFFDPPEVSLVSPKPEKSLRVRRRGRIPNLSDGFRGDLTQVPPGLRDNIGSAKPRAPKPPPKPPELPIYAPITRGLGPLKNKR